MAFGRYILERISRPIVERCGRLLKRVQSWELHVSQKMQVLDPDTAAITREHESALCAVG